jgi:hypothetical protein
MPTVPWKHGTPWIGVDLDGTLAHYAYGTGQQGIGDPIPSMLEHVQRWIAEGREVRILTARVAPHPDLPGRERLHATMIQDWCESVGLPRLTVTCVKDPDMVELYDDRAVTIEPNTGRALTQSRRGLLG